MAEVVNTIILIVAVMLFMMWYMNDKR